MARRGLGGLGWGIEVEVKQGKERNDQEQREEKEGMFLLSDKES